MNTTFYKNLVMNGLFHGELMSIPEDYYLGFSKTLPDIDGTGVMEPSRTGTGYTRIRLENMTKSNTGVIYNTNVISFPESELEWGEMTAYVVYDSVSDGNLLFYGNLSKNITVDANTAVTIPAGQMVISLLD